MNKKREYPERELQKACVQFLELQAPKSLFWTAINPISQKPVHLAVLSQDMGMRKSVPDMLFINFGRTFFVEYKHGAGKPDKSQRELFAELSAQNINVHIVHSVDELKGVLKKEGVL